MIYINWHQNVWHQYARPAIWGSGIIADILNTFRNGAVAATATLAATEAVTVSTWLADDSVVLDGSVFLWWTIFGCTTLLTGPACSCL